MNDAMKHDTDRWPEEARLDMIEKSEWYENPKNYQYGYYDGYQRARAEMLAEKDRQLAELQKELRDCNAMAVRQIVPAETAVDDLMAELAEAQAEIESRLAEREYLVTKIEKLETHVSRISTDLAFYQGPAELYNIRAVQHYQEENARLETELAEARAEIERLRAPALNASLLREKLAELAHNQWAGWMEYLFFKSKQVDGCVVIPAWANERWRRQVATRYADLSEEEKDSDRSEADKFLAVFNAQLAERDKLIEQMREALIAADDLIDEYAADYEHRDNVDEIREEIKAALAAERSE